LPLNYLGNLHNDNIEIPTQSKEFEVTPKKEISKSLFGGFIAGTLTSFLPGLGASQGAAIASSFLKDMSSKGFLIMIGGINTINFLMSIAAYYTISKARNGSIIAITKLIPVFNFKLVLLFLIIALIVGGISATLCLKISSGFAYLIQRVSYKKTIYGVIIIVTLTVLFISNFWGLILYLSSIALGLISIKLNIAKNHLMGCLLVPIIIYFI
jgi:TctA family transporter